MDARFPWRLTDCFAKVLCALHRLFFQALLKKMTSASRRFPWRYANLLLLLLIGAIVAYDTQKHGSFEGECFLWTVTLIIRLASHLISAYPNHFVFLNSLNFEYRALISIQIFYHNVRLFRKLSSCLAFIGITHHSNEVDWSLLTMYLLLS